MAFSHPNELSWVYVISFDQWVCIMKIISKQRICETLWMLPQTLLLLLCWVGIFWIERESSSVANNDRGTKSPANHLWPAITLLLYTCMTFITTVGPSQPQLPHTKNTSCDFSRDPDFPVTSFEEPGFHWMDIVKAILHILKALMGKGRLVET